MSNDENTGFITVGKGYFTDLEQLLNFLDNCKKVCIPMGPIVFNELEERIKETINKGYYLECPDEELEKELDKTFDEMEESMKNYFFRMANHFMRMHQKAVKRNSERCKNVLKRNNEKHK